MLRDGQHSGQLVKLLANVAPFAASSDSTVGIIDSDAAVWSSVITTTTLGCVCPGSAP